MTFRRVLVAALASSAVLLNVAQADEGGISFWLPGQYGSFAATPLQPGWSWTSVYYHSSVKTGAGQQLNRGGQVSVGLRGSGDVFIAGPGYTFDNPVFGGAQLTLSMLGAAARSEASVDALLTGPSGATRSGRRSDDVTGFGDLYPTAMLRWNDGVNNFMTYVTGDIPVGAYRPDRLANLGIGHGAIDVGGGYTYFNPATGFEASAVLGATYNFKNPDTDYRNGVDLHLDWGVSQFLNERFFIGAVGYYYQQVTGDSGSGATLGDFKSRVAGIGPQVGYLFPIGDKMQGALNLKAYKEFAAENRAEGWNVWLAFSLSLAPPKKAN